MSLWAYATSPHGLGLSTEDFWLLCDREMQSLMDIQQGDAVRWAITQALSVNMNLAKNEEPFLAEDFLGTGDRAQRKRQREIGKREVDKLNRELEEKISKPGAPVDLALPDWAT